jgi:hypothetical protein
LLDQPVIALLVQRHASVEEKDQLQVIRPARVEYAAVEVAPGSPLPARLVIVVVATGQATQAYKKKQLIGPRDFFL